MKPVRPQRTRALLQVVMVPVSLLAATIPAAAQTPDTMDAQVYHLYHASRGESWVLKPDGRPTSLPATPLQTVAPTGDKVCVRVVNPHPGLYRYSMRATVDTSKVEHLPKEASQLIAVLGTVFPKRPQAEGDAPGGAFLTFGERGMPEDLQTDDPIGRYALALQELGREITGVQEAVENSDRPGTIRNEGGIFRVEAGREQEFRWVRETINSLSDAAGRFRSSKLEADLDSIHQRAVTDARKDPKHSEGGELNVAAQFTLESLRIRGRNLLTLRNSLEGTYKGQPDVIVCENVGRGRSTTFNLHVQPRDTAKEELARRQRVHDTLPVLRVRAATRFPRSTVELIPVGLMHHSPDAPEYAFESDTLRFRSESTTGFRFGGMFLVNALQFGREREFAFGPGLGFGIGGEGKVLSDYLGAVMLSFRDVARIGFGAGYSVLESRLVGSAQVGRPRPAAAKDLADILEDRREPSGFLIFSITGLKLPIPIPGT